MPHSHSDLPPFLAADPLPPWSPTLLHDHPVPLAHDNQGQNIDDLLKGRHLALSWSEHLYSAHQDHESQQPLAPSPSLWPSHSIYWQQMNGQYPLQGQLDANAQEHLTSTTFSRLPILSVPATYSQPGSNSRPQSASYSSASPISYDTSPSSPYSFPPSPLSFDPSINKQLPDSNQPIYVHPSDLSAPLQTQAVLSIPERDNYGASGNPSDRSHLAIQHSTNQSSQPTVHVLPRPATRSRNVNQSLARTPTSESGYASDVKTSNQAPRDRIRSSRRSAVRHRGEKRKRTSPRPSTAAPAITTRSTRNTQEYSVNRRSLSRNGSNGRTKRCDNPKTSGRSIHKHEASEGSGITSREYTANDDQDGCDYEDLEDNDEYQTDEEDGSYSTSNSSFSPSSSPAPSFPTSNNASNVILSATNNVDYKPRTRRNNGNGRLPLPVPVPNLTKKSRGRKVPSVSSGGMSTSAMDTNADSNDGPGNTADLRQRGYLCRVPGCGKCFVRGEHLKRHVRSIHTYEKPHACPHHGCDKTFSRRDNLAQHLRVHR